MRLSKIKLSGFKSFVDPTTFDISSDLTGIVGPNGCGKSNLIDAITWVMGERSAKTLRGEQLSDVIFNGSGQRKPIGQATVELIFDNHKKPLDKPYAQWSELAIKRQITRDGVSSYFLNGTRCRRRDITSLFLGTGLGARGYAIIEQGTISRLVEARPEEIRSCIEEAAGISRYRQRRREAMNRIQNTQENVKRIEDIQKEIEAQWTGLSKQAAAAEKFQALKQREKVLRVECLSLQWQMLHDTLERCQQKLQEKTRENDEKMSKKMQLETHLEEMRETLHQANQKLNACQADSYRISSERAQDESNLERNRQHIAEMTKELESIGQHHKQAAEEQQTDDKQIAEIEHAWDALQPSIHAAEEDSAKADLALKATGKAWLRWQTEWEDYHRSTAAEEQQRQLEQASLEHLRVSIQQNDEQQTILREEEQALDDRKLIEKQVAEQSRHAQAKALWEHCKGASEAARNTLEKDRQRLARVTGRLEAAQTEQHVLAGQLSALETLQKEHTRRQDPALKSWLQKHHLDDCKYLVEQIQVDSEWIHAFETVFGPFLQHLCVTDLQSLLQDKTLTTHEIGFSSPASGLPETDGRSRLIDKIRNTSTFIPQWFGSVYTAENLQEAIVLRKTLRPHQSVVSREGVWMGQNWLLTGSTDPERGALRREQSIEHLQAQVQAAAAKVQHAQAEQKTAHKILHQTETERATLISKTEQAQIDMAEVAASLSAIETHITQNQDRRQRIQNERSRLQQTKIQYEEEHAALVDSHRVLKEKQEAAQHRQDTLSEQRGQYSEDLERARAQWQSTRQTVSTLRLQMETLESRKTILSETRERTTKRVRHLLQRQHTLQNTLAQCQLTMPEMSQALETKRAAQTQAEARLNEAHKTLQSIQDEVQNAEQQRQQQEQDYQTQQTVLQEIRIEQGEHKVRLEGITTQLAALSELSPDALVTSLPAKAELTEWQKKLLQLEQDLQLVAPVNLRAIDELQGLQNRKTELDAQHDDLLEALGILDAAIARIDRETRSRFKSTFDQINTHMAETFPRLFGGGRAQLKLCDGDLLETGVIVTAKPPGKQNSTIHTLSGGEKSLTAIALVFAIFKLNPAPFCILDEVDAPLDDSNTKRFSDMLVSLSQDVQFLFITHNKITMEAAHILIGVTMQEAGVSRLVSVDLQRATEQTAASA